MAHVSGHGELPVRVLRGQFHRGPDGHQAVALAVQQQHRHLDPRQQPAQPTPAAQHRQHRAGGHHEVPGYVGEIGPGPTQRPVGGGHRLGDPAGVDTAQFEAVHGHLLGRAHPAPSGDRRSPQPGGEVGGEQGADQRVRPVARQREQRRVDQHRPGHQLRVVDRLEHGDQGAHRVAHPDRRASGHLGDEPPQQGAVRGDGGGAAVRPGQAEPGQVRREHAAGRGKQRPQGQPVGVRTAQTMDGDHRRALRRATEVEVVHRPVQVDPAHTGRFRRCVDDVNPYL